MNNKYEAVIGLEVHVELKTDTKAFCSCSTEFGAVPNTNVCPVCLGMPGALPVLNRKAVLLALKACIAFNCEVNREMWFDRKNYFYPDLPKGYQITQYEKPIGRNGFVTIDTENGKKKIGLERIHIEEDAGKMIHRGVESLLDCNRCGIPLAEIVSKPDLASSKEAKCYLETLRRTLSYLGVSDCKMNEGSMRCDINISLKKKGEKELGTKVEIKNLNSINYAGKAIEFEIERQSGILDNGELVSPETRRFDEESGETVLMRKKETEIDYRYFTEPDIPQINISCEYIDSVKKSMGMMPDEMAEYISAEFGVREDDALLITSSSETAELFVSLASATEHRGACVSLFISEIIGECTDGAIQINPAYFAKICAYMADGKIVSGVAKKLLRSTLEENLDPDVIVERDDLLMITDEDKLSVFVREAVEMNPKAAQDFKSGKNAAVKQIIGTVMRNTRGKADPVKTEKIAVAYLLDEDNDRTN